MSLAEYVKNAGTLTATTALNIVAQVALGLQHLHRNKIAHLAVDENNVVVTEQAVGGACFKLRNFGTAKRLRPEMVGRRKHCSTFDEKQVSDFGTLEKTDLIQLGGVLGRLLDADNFQERFSATQRGVQALWSLQARMRSGAVITAADVVCECSQTVHQQLR